jgi:ribosomal-protein-alanine N-acetyltransferase
MIRTARLTLRQWREEDKAPFAALNADPEVMEHFPATLTREQSDAFVEQAALAIDARGWGLWAVDAEGELIGFVGLNEPGFMPGVEVGWRLARHAWGHGYATEAARAAVAYGFDELQLHEIISFTSATNVRSQRVMQRLGMTRNPEDDFDHPRVDDPRLRRHVLYRLAFPR